MTTRQSRTKKTRETSRGN